MSDTAFPINFEFTYQGSDAWILDRKGNSYIVCYDHSSKATVLTHAELSAALKEQ
jgi:hypothetical protein